jgi:hypothetical protein
VMKKCVLKPPPLPEEPPDPLSDIIKEGTLVGTTHGPVSRQFFMRRRIFRSWWEVFAIAGAAALMVSSVLYLAYFKPREPSLEDRVKALEMEVRIQRDQIVFQNETTQQAEELHQETVFGLWETINSVEKRCEECLHSCGGID